METMETHFTKGPRRQTWVGEKFCHKNTPKLKFKKMSKQEQRRKAVSQVKSEMIGGNLLAVIILCC